MITYTMRLTTDSIPSTKGKHSFMPQGYMITRDNERDWFEMDFAGGPYGKLYFEPAWRDNSYWIKSVDHNIMYVFEMPEPSDEYTRVEWWSMGKEYILEIKKKIES